MTTQHDQTTLTRYIAGFGLSILFTGISFASVAMHWFTGGALVAFILLLATIQASIQLMLFLHLGDEAKPRWKLGIFWLMIMVLAILVGGSLWIMRNLDYNMSPQAMSNYLMKDEGVQKR